MKYKILIIALLAVQTLNSGCSGLYVNGQSNQKTQAIETGNVRSDNAIKDEARNNNSPGDRTNELLLQGVIVLKEKLKKQNLTEEEMSETAKVLGWNSSKEYCGSVKQTSYDLETPQKKIQTRIFPVAAGIFVVNLSCEGGDNNMFYLYSEKNDLPTARKMTFEYFEKDVETGKYAKHITYFPNGATQFNTKTKELTVLANFISTAHCGYSSTYQFKQEKPILKEVRANWDCENDYPFNKQWEKENIQKMRKLTAETFDEAKEFENSLTNPKN